MVEPWLTFLRRNIIPLYRPEEPTILVIPFCQWVNLFYTLLNTKGESYSGPMFGDVLQHSLFLASLNPSSAIFEPFSYCDPQIPNVGLYSNFQIFLFFFPLKHHYFPEKVQFSSVAQSCLTLSDPMDCSTLGFPVLHQLLELVQTYVHPVSDAIQPSHPLSPPSPPAFNLSQHQGLFGVSFFSEKVSYAFLRAKDGGTVSQGMVTLSCVPYYQKYKSFNLC